MDQYKFYEPSPPRRYWGTWCEIKHSSKARHTCPIPTENRDGNQLCALLKSDICRPEQCATNAVNECVCCVVGDRRGNWITLKMRKLIKSKKDGNRERLKSVTLTPTRSESSEGFLQLPHQDSQDSSSVGSNSLEDGQTLGTKKSSSEYCKPLGGVNKPWPNVGKVCMLWRICKGHFFSL